MSGRVKLSSGELIVKGRRAREEETAVLRQHKREEVARKRRAAFGLYAAENAAVKAEKERFEEYVFAAKSGDAGKIKSGLMCLCLLLSNEEKSVIDAVMASGVLAVICECLGDAAPADLQQIAAACFTNMCCGSHEQTVAVCSCGAVPSLIRLVGSADPKVRAQAVWALGNIAGDSTDGRDFLLQSGVLDAVATVVPAVSGLEDLRGLSWSVCNMVRGVPHPEMRFAVQALGLLAPFLYHDDSEVLVNASWGLSYFSSAGEEACKIIVERNFVPQLVTLLNHKDATVFVPCLRTLGNISTGDEVMTQTIINSGALPHILRILSSSDNTTVLSDACWVLSNIAAGNKDQINAVIQGDFLPLLRGFVRNAPHTVKKNASYVICNLFLKANTAQLRRLILKQGLDMLNDILDVKDVEVIKVCLSAIFAVLKLGERDIAFAGENTYANLLDLNGAVDKIDDLQEHEDYQIYEMSSSIIQRFYSEGDSEEFDDDENIDSDMGPKEFVFNPAPIGEQKFDFSDASMF